PWSQRHAGRAGRSGRPGERRADPHHGPAPRSAEDLGALSDDTRGWLKAYADGVNHWLRNNPLPPEYAALELTRVPEWSPVDTLVIGKALAFQLSFDLDIEQTLRFAAYQQAGAAGGFDGAALYFGDTHRIAPPDDRVTVPGFMTGGATADTGDDLAKLAGQALYPVAPIGEDTIAMARALQEKLANVQLLGFPLGRREDLIGSNEWAVHGQHTASGKAL